MYNPMNQMVVRNEISRIYLEYINVVPGDEKEELKEELDRLRKVYKAMKNKPINPEPIKIGQYKIYFVSYVNYDGDLLWDYVIKWNGDRKNNRTAYASTPHPTLNSAIDEAKIMVNNLRRG